MESTDGLHIRPRNKDNSPPKNKRKFCHPVLNPNGSVAISLKIDEPSILCVAYNLVWLQTLFP